MATQDGNSRDSSMMHLFLNCLAASAGAGLTYVRNIVPHLASRTDLRATILLTPALRVEFGTFSNSSPSRQQNRFASHHLTYPSSTSGVRHFLKCFFCRDGNGKEFRETLLAGTEAAAGFHPPQRGRRVDLDWKLRAAKFSHPADPSLGKFALHI